MPAGWTVPVEKDALGYYFAAVTYEGRVLCRMSFCQDFESASDAERELLLAARRWIADHLAQARQPQSGRGV